METLGGEDQTALVGRKAIMQACSLNLKYLETSDTSFAIHLHQAAEGQRSRRVALRKINLLFLFY